MYLNFFIGIGKPEVKMVSEITQLEHGWQGKLLKAQNNDILGECILT